LLKYLGLLCLIVLMAYINDIVSYIHQNTTMKHSGHCQMCDINRYSIGGATNFKDLSPKQLERIFEE